MYQIFWVHILKAIKDLCDNLQSVLKSEVVIMMSILDVVNVPFVAVFHEHEHPAFIYDRDGDTFKGAH